MNRATERRRQLIAEIKSAPCFDCKKRYPPYVMDFDHRPGTEKRSTVAAIAPSASLGRVLGEIAKCDLVCSNCHRERTHRRLISSPRAKPPSERQAQYHLRRKAVLDSMKGDPCADCRKRYPAWVMDFDHRPGTKKLEAVSSLRAPHAILLEEIAKCDVVCSNCHRERTHSRSRKKTD
jgi:hypothetical protein